jgi:hypothetical protein
MRDAALRSEVLSVVCWELKQKAGATAALFKYSHGHVFAAMLTLLLGFKI